MKGETGDLRRRVSPAHADSEADGPTACLESVGMTCAGLRWMLLTLAFPLTSAGAAAPSRDLTVFQKQFQTQHDKYLTQLGRYRTTFTTLELPAFVAEIERLSTVPKATELKGEPLPERIGIEPPEAIKGEALSSWNGLNGVRKKHAGELFALSNRVLKAGFASYAYNLVREVVRHDPDHDKARRILGYVRYEGRWVSPLTADMLRRGNVWDDRYGWLPKGHLEQYESGKEYLEPSAEHPSGAFVSAAKAAEVRRDFRKAWKIRTDHYEIRTNQSLEYAVELGRRLEEYHELFHEVFAGFFSTPEQMQKLFSGTGNVAGALRPKLINCYRTKAEYVDRLKDRFPQIDQTNGLYYTTDRTVHFFYEENEDSLATLYHEASHQIFYESQPNERAIAEDAHFWIIEGIACYMESFRQTDSGVSLGDPAYIRFENARQTLLVDRYYLPLREFSAMGSREFQHHPQVGKNYSQASGLAAFFMHAEDGAYREALVTHLAQLYSANAGLRARARSLDDLTGVRFEDLDRQYAEFLRDFRPESTR